LLQREIRMNKETANKMNLKVVEFLSKYGSYPAVKNVDERILSAENRLNNKLLRLQAGVEAEFIQALRERGYLFGTYRERKRFVSQILEVPFNEMKTVIADEAVESAELGRQITFEEILEQGMEVVFNQFSEQVQQRLWEKTYQFSEDTFMRIQGDFIQTLTNGYDEGLGIDEVARNLRGDFKDLRDNRLKTIARTEIQSSQNEGSHQTMRDYGVRYKQWLTVGDSRVRGRDPDDRYDHIHLHGQVVEMDERFSNGMNYPGERSGDIGDWINCRCRERPYIPRKGETILVTPYYPSAS